MTQTDNLRDNFKKACDDESICYSMDLTRFYLSKDGHNIHIIFYCPFCGDKIAV